MRVIYSPTNTLLEFDKEATTPSVFAFTPAHENAFSLPSMPNMRKADWGGKDTSGSVPVSAEGGPTEHQQLAGSVQVPVSTMSSANAAAVEALDLIPTHSEHLASFLGPDTYIADQRASNISHAVNSLYAWSSASDADMFRPEAPSVNQSVSTSPFMQSYYTFGPSQPSLSSQIQGVSGYTSQQIDKWCMESGPAGNFCLSTTPYPAISPVAYPSTKTQSNVYPANNIGQQMSSAEQWIPQAAFAGPSSTTATSPPTEVFLSATSAPAVSIDSASVMSTSPAPTLSDFDSSSTSRHGPSSPPSNPADLTRYGILAGDGFWRCAHPGCTSQALFRRGCDLRKHFNRHRKHLFCRHEGCPQSKQGGFSSKKDRARHEAKHNPGIVCEWDGCGRVFSRVDNMKDHVRRIHRRGGSRRS